MPKVLALTTFTNHIEILNRCRTDEERVFYMLYAAHQKLKTEELRRSIVTQTYSTILDKEKMMSPNLRDNYPNVEFILKDKAIVDFLNLPTKSRSPMRLLTDKGLLWGLLLRRSF